MIIIIFLLIHSCHSDGIGVVASVVVVVMVVLMVVEKVTIAI